MGGKFHVYSSKRQTGTQGITGRAHHVLPVHSSENKAGECCKFSLPSQTTVDTRKDDRRKSLMQLVPVEHSQASWRTRAMYHPSRNQIRSQKHRRETNLCSVYQVRKAPKAWPEGEKLRLQPARETNAGVQNIT